MKKRICLVCDVKGWAFDLIAQDIKNKLNYKYDFRVRYLSYEENDDMSQKLFELLDENDDCDLIHFFLRKTLIVLGTTDFKELLIKRKIDYDNYILEKKKKITTGVYDFLYLNNKEKINKFKNIFNNYVKAYYVNSQKLYNKYLEIEEYRQPLMIVNDIFNSSIFKPERLERFMRENIINRPLVIGWVGNGERMEDNIDLKGLNTIIKPVISKLIDEGYLFTEEYADRNVQWIPHTEMPEYYRKIDLCLITSTHEGTPLPALEAMSCGIPLISTDVGVINELFGEKQRKFIIGSRDYGKNDEQIRNLLKQKLIEFYNHRELFEELSKENIESLKKYIEINNINKYDNFFESCL